MDAQTIVILAGKGHNGGGGLVAARYLSNWGANIVVLLSHEEGLKTTVMERLRTLRRLPVTIRPFRPQNLSQQFSKASLILDALLGYNIQGDPRYPISALIRAANASGQPILALDLPSGLDATTGMRYTPCIQATRTMTLALPKRGLLVPTAREIVGELYLADIGIPSTVYQDLGLTVENPFTNTPRPRIY